MTTRDFIQRIIERFPKLSGTPNLDDIQEKIADMSGHELENLYNAFINEYMYSRTPRWADLYKIARENGVKLGGDSSIKNGYFVCQVCGSAYDMQGRMCPVCHKITPIVVHDGERPRNFYYMREECGNCIYYLSEDLNSMGPICDFYGSESSNKLDDCKRCNCKKCCFESKVMRLAMQGDTALYEKMEQQEKWEDRRLKK